MSYTLIVVFQAPDGKENQLCDALNHAATISKSENTCLEYRLHQGIENLGQFVLYEVWESKEAHQEHFKTEHIQKLLETLSTLGVAYPQEFFLTEKKIEDLSSENLKEKNTAKIPALDLFFSSSFDPARKCDGKESTKKLNNSSIFQ
jgi:quinol monooxygenase YgiN